MRSKSKSPLASGEARYIFEQSYEIPARKAYLNESKPASVTLRPMDCFQMLYNAFDVACHYKKIFYEEPDFGYVDPFDRARAIYEALTSDEAAALAPELQPLLSEFAEAIAEAVALINESPDVRGRVKQRRYNSATVAARRKA